MNFTQKNKPNELNLDKDHKYLSSEEAFFLRNHELYVNIKNGKGNLGKSTPKIGNYLACEIEQPSGENYCVGVYRSPITQKVYSFHYNSENQHYILRISQSGCEIVYQGSCLDFSADPKHYISQFRCWVFVRPNCTKQSEILLFTKGKGEVNCLDVEASIATNSFNTSFFENCTKECDLIQLCVPLPCGCLNARFVYNEVANLNNLILDQSFKFRYQYVYYDGRQSEWSKYSSVYYLDSKGCFDNSDGKPSCLKIRIPLGNAMVSKVNIGYSTGDSNTLYLYDTIEKYKRYNDKQVEWYEKELAPMLNYSNVDCSFDYIFCNDKDKTVVDPKESNRIYNPIPRDAQGIIPVNNSLGIYNYKQGVCPIDTIEASKFKIIPKCEDLSCTAEYVDVVIRCVIHNRDMNLNELIYRLNGVDGLDDITDTLHYGGLDDGANSNEVITSMGQRFKDKTRGFIIYFEGTEYFGETKQYRAELGFKNIGSWTAGGLGDNQTRGRYRGYVRGGYRFFSETTIRVPKGFSGFARISSQYSTDNNQITSTTVAGNMSIKTYCTFINVFDNLNPEKELFIDTCNAVNGKLEVENALVIEDLASANGTNSSGSSACQGYVKDANNRPIEGVLVKAAGTRACQTDHNGFYYCIAIPGRNANESLEVFVEKNCNDFVNVLTKPILMEEYATVYHDAIIEDLEYKDDYFARVNVNILDCNNQPIGGVKVALSGSKTAVSNGLGVATFRIRNYHTRNRSLRAVMINSKGCIVLDCRNNCNPCLPTLVANAPSCFKKISTTNPIINLGSIIVNTENTLVSKRGLKKGGKYLFSFVAFGDCGRVSTINEIDFINIPKEQENGKGDYCKFMYNGNDIKFPDWVTCISILRTENLNPFEIQILVDKVERTADNKLKITFQSLNDYNESYFFKTNTKYQFLEGDRVEFISNGDGKLYDTTTHGILNYQIISPFLNKEVIGSKTVPADFFNQILIEDDGRLDGLKPGAKIELRRPKAAKTDITEYDFREICNTIQVVNGKLVHNVGIFETFDAFIVNRKLGTFPSQSFEHHSPSDFWGSKISDLGRYFKKNDFLIEQRVGRNISVSNQTPYNIFGNIVKTFDSREHGDITAMFISDNKVVLAIGENDNFLTQTADDIVRVSNGVAIAARGADVFSEPQPKLLGRYGCQYEDIGSIFMGDGFVTWVDAQSQKYIRHDYNTGVAVSDNLVSAWFTQVCQNKKQHNKLQVNNLNKFRWSTGNDITTGKLYVTIKKLRDNGINNTKGILLQDNDTICYDPMENKWREMVSFTPEAYTTFNLETKYGCSFITFLHGKPYIHPVLPITHNEFYGEAVDRIIGIAVNVEPTKIKTPISFELQSNKMYFIDSVKTDDENFLSEIPPSVIQFNGKKSNASFLNNINSLGGLFGNDKNISTEKAVGYSVSCIFVRDNTDALKYKTIDRNKRLMYDELDIVIFKFQIDEQSGFTENV